MVENRVLTYLLIAEKACRQKEDKMNVLKPTAAVLAALLCAGSANVFAVDFGHTGQPGFAGPSGFPGWVPGPPGWAGGANDPADAMATPNVEADRPEAAGPDQPGFGQWGPKDAGQRPGAPWSGQRPPH